MSTSDPDPRKQTGAEGDASADTSTPFTPREDDDTPVGDTDQHSKVDHSKDPADGIKADNAAND
ncbi:MAG: hypothetical protein JHD16_10825 [Solirubrobacteraceae bacterium]|nr:hypothetical protein [Solirubrobacteraceae bacterium]